jgi:carbamoyl-phosphate synthase large subunit
VELLRFIKDTFDKNGIDGKVFACDMQKTAPAMFFADKALTVPPISADDYVDAVIGAARDTGADIIIPTIDTELLPLARRREEIIEKTGAVINLSSLRTIEICRSKKNTASFLEENGFLTPKILSGHPRPPVFIKPDSGSSSINAHKAETEAELAFYSQNVPGAIIQEYIQGEEYTVDVFSDFAANPVTAVPRKRLAVRSGEILKGYITKDPEIIGQCVKLVKALALWGHNTIQCMKTEKGLYFIEINPRFGGGAPMSLRAGADSIMNLFRLRCGEPLAYTEDYMSDIFCARFDDSVFFDGNGDVLRL